MRNHSLKSAIRRHLPLILALGPIIVTATLFVVTLLLLDASDAFGTGERSGSQRFVQTIGDLTAGATYIGFAYLVPLGLIAGAALFIRRHTRR